MRQTTHLYLVPKLGITAAILPISLHVFVACAESTLLYFAFYITEVLAFSPHVVSIPENANSVPHRISLSTVTIKFTYRLFNNTINI